MRRISQVRIRVFSFAIRSTLRSNYSNQRSKQSSTSSIRCTTSIFQKIIFFRLKTLKTAKKTGKNQQKKPKPFAIRSTTRSNYSKHCSRQNLTSSVDSNPQFSHQILRKSANRSKTLDFQVVLQNPSRFAQQCVPIIPNSVPDRPRRALSNALFVHLF